jgi:hypothetical protein
MKIRTIRTAMLALAIGVAGIAQSASAAIMLLDNYVFNLGAVPGFAGFGTIGTVGGNGVDQILVAGIGHQHLGNELPGGGPLGFGTPDAGEVVAADILLRATGFPDIPAGLTSTGMINEIHYEMTFSFSGALAVGAVTPDGFGGFNFNLSHLPGPNVVDGFTYDGILEIFLDAPANAVGDETLSNPGANGGDFTDGTLVATFRVIPGGGGPHNTRTLDGSDDATFELLSAIPGFLLDNAGNDIGVPGLLVGVTDTNFDLDPDNDGAPNSAPAGGWPAYDGGGFAFPGSGTFADSFLEENGSADIGLAVVPEPLSLAVWTGIAGLAGVATVIRRKRK